MTVMVIMRDSYTTILRGLSVKVQKSKKMHSKQNNVKRNTVISVLLALVVVVALIGIFLVRSNGQQVVLQIGDTRVSQAEYVAYQDSAKIFNTDKEGVRKELIDYYKNKQVAEKFDLPMNSLFIDEQWSGVVSEHSKDSLEAKKLYTKEDEAWAQILKYNKLYETLSRALQKEALVGAVYHIPYSSQGKLGAKQQADEIISSIKTDRTQGLSIDKKLLEELPSKIQQASASRSGAYLLFKDSSGLRIGGTFGVRGGIIPVDMANTIFSTNLPVISDVVDVQDSAFYVVHATKKIDATKDIPEKLQQEKNNIRVVEYDR